MRRVRVDWPALTTGLVMTAIILAFYAWRTMAVDDLIEANKAAFDRLSREHAEIIEAQRRIISILEKQR